MVRETWVNNQVTGVLFCTEAKQLLEAFGRAVQELVRLHEEQFSSIINGDADNTRFDDLIYMANERKNRAKYDYLKHLEVHGCSTYDGTDKK